MLEKEEIDYIIKKLEESNSKNDATFGLYYADGEDEMHIKANKGGFELFAANLLKISRDSEKIINNPKKDYVDFGYNEEWIQGEMIAYIKPISEDRKNLKPSQAYPKTLKTEIEKYGCFTIIGIIIVSIFVGLYTMISWL